MAREQPGFEPAFAYSILATLAPFFLFGTAVLLGSGFNPNPAASTALLWLMAPYALLSLGINGAMAEPLPRKPDAGRAPLRLRASWALLGLLPPPGRASRFIFASAASILMLLPVSQMGLWDFICAAALLWTSWGVRKPKTALAMGAGEGRFYAAAWLAFIWGLLTAALGSHEGALRCIPVLAVLPLLVGQRAREVSALKWAELLPEVPPPPALDLSRFEISVERQGPAPALPAGVEEQLVDSGSFRVDPKKMLEKLRERQLADPQDFICAWLRCAAASQATRIDLKTTATELRLSFDGTPFAPAELAQPYQVLLEGDGPAAARGRHLAYGLLALYRLKPRRITVTSRGGETVAVMNTGREELPDAGSAPQGTVITVAWPLWAAVWRPLLTQFHARSRYGLGPSRLFINDQPVPPWPARQGEQLVHSGWRAAFQRKAGEGLLHLYVLGTFIETLEEESPKGVEAWLAHDGLELDISQASVLRNALFKRGLALVRDRAG